MSSQSEYLKRAQAVVAVFAREVMDNRVQIPGREARPAELPESVRLARRFYEGHLLGDDSYGFVLVYQLPADTGAALLVVAYGTESLWGAVEIYSPTGELWAAGVHIAAGVAWLDADVVRRAMADIHPPYALMPGTAALDWIVQGPACVSVGGRFFVQPPNPDLPTPRFVLTDHITRTEHPCDSIEAARALAVTLHAGS